MTEQKIPTPGEFGPPVPVGGPWNVAGWYLETVEGGDRGQNIGADRLLLWTPPGELRLAVRIPDLLRRHAAGDVPSRVYEVVWRFLVRNENAVYPQPRFEGGRMPSRIKRVYERDGLEAALVEYRATKVWAPKHKSDC